MSSDPFDPPTIDEDWEARSALAEAMAEEDLHELADLDTLLGRLVIIGEDPLDNTKGLLTIQVPLHAAQRIGHLLTHNALVSVIE